MVFDRMPADPAFVGIPTFLKLPLVVDAAQLAAERPDVVIVGAPFDMASITSLLCGVPSFACTVAAVN